MREPWGISAYQSQSALVALSGTVRPMTAVRLRGQTLAALDAGTARRIREQLRDFAALGGFTLTGQQSGWIGSAVHTPADAEAAFDLAERLAERTLPAARPGLRHVQEQTGLRAPADLAGWRNLFGFLDGVATTLTQFHEDVFRVDLATHIASAADAAWRREHAGQPGTDAGWLTRRRMRKQAAQLWRGPGKPSRQQLFTGLTTALTQRAQWTRATADGGPPRLPAELARARTAFEQLDGQVAQLQRYVPHLALAGLDLDRLATALSGLAGDERTLRRIRGSTSSAPRSAASASTSSSPTSPAAAPTPTSPPPSSTRAGTPRSCSTSTSPTPASARSTARCTPARSRSSAARTGRTSTRPRAASCGPSPSTSPAPATSTRMRAAWSSTRPTSSAGTCRSASSSPPPRTC